MRRPLATGANSFTFRCVIVHVILGPPNLKTMRYFLLVLTSLCLMHPLTAFANDRVFTTEELLDGFDKTVFGLEYRRWSWRPYQVKKYTEPVRFYVHNLSGIDRKAMVHRFINQLEGKIHGLQVKIVSKPEEANFQIYVVDRSKYQETVRKHVYEDKAAKAPGRCLVRVISGRKGIKRSVAVIVSDEGEFIFRRCMIEETLQGLGPMNDDNSLTHSVFNDQSRHNRFTTFDQFILNMLYDERVHPGMSRKDTDKILPQVLQSVRHRLQ